MSVRPIQRLVKAKPTLEGAGVHLRVQAADKLAEPVAWYGPIVMNTQEQLRQAFDELERGTFLETKGRR